MSEAASPSPAVTRLQSLDAYRGFVMLAMASGGLGLSRVAEHFPQSRVWQFLGYQADHVAWEGCAVWDLIQPSFMFMAGVALPFSYAARRAKGDGYLRIAGHAFYRSLILVALGVFLYSMGKSQTNFTFVNVLAQIGLGYGFLFLLANRPNWFVWLSACGILAGYWLAFVWHPSPPAGLDLSKLGAANVEPYAGFFAHWNKNTNYAADWDVWFLNLFPQPQPFRYNGGGYQTLNFVPSLATMIFGLLAGRLMLSPATASRKMATLIIAGAAALLVGWVLGMTVCPIVKRIWTPSWAIFSAGWTLWMLAAFYGVIDVQGWRRWSFPLLVVGANSIAMYMLAETLEHFIAETLHTHLNYSLHRLFGYELFGGTYGPIVKSVSVVFVLWLVCYWMWRKRIFIRI